MAVETYQVTKAKQVLALPGYSYLTERLGEYFPHIDSSWLTDENDSAFAQHLTSDAGGWLSPQQDHEFWTLIQEASDTEPSDSLVSWLGALLDGWGAALADGEEDTSPGQEEPGAGPGGETVPRFSEDQIAPVGADYPDWWQGYDQVEGVWKYLKSSTKPASDWTGWMVSDQAFAIMQGAADPGYDEQAWQAYLAENGPQWDGTDASWDQFREWFAYYADQQGLDAPATAFLDSLAAQPAAERIATFAQYGVTITAPQEAAVQELAAAEQGGQQTAEPSDAELSDEEIESLLGDALEEPAGQETAEPADAELSDEEIDSIAGDALKAHPEIADMPEEELMSAISEVLDRLEAG